MSVAWPDLKAGVGALLDTVIDANSTPSETQVSAWVYDATIQMCELLPDSQVSSFEKISAYAACGQYADLTAYNVLRVTAAYKNGKACTLISRDDMDRIKAASLLMYDDSNIAYCVGPQSSLGTSVVFHPATVFNAEVRYIQYPNSSITLWGSSTAGAPPGSWRALLVEYAVMKAKYQDEEVELSEQAHKNWQEKVQVTLSGKTIGSKGA